jgi:hypothetical protein
VAALVIDTVPILGCCIPDWSSAGPDRPPGGPQAGTMQENRPAGQLPLNAFSVIYIGSPAFNFNISGPG